MSTPAVVAHRRVAVFFGGVMPSDSVEEQLAYEVGVALGQAGFILRHGGYNGLMEQAARGASEHQAPITAITVQGMAWGAFNPYVTNVVRAPDLGTRISAFLDDADVVVAMGGGVGTLHEITTAIWYAGNIRPVPVWLVGTTMQRLHDFLREQRWLVETPTRPLGFLRLIADHRELRDALAATTAAGGRR